MPNPLGGKKQETVLDEELPAIRLDDVKEQNNPVQKATLMEEIIYNQETKLDKELPVLNPEETKEQNKPVQKETPMKERIGAEESARRGDMVNTNTYLGEALKAKKWWMDKNAGELDDGVVVGKPLLSVQEA